MNAADLRSLLLDQSDIVAMVQDRIFPSIIPKERWDVDSKKPCIVYSGDGIDRTYTFCGNVKLHADIININAYSISYDTTAQLAAEIATLEGFKGIVGSTKIGPVFLENEIDLLDLEPGLYRRLLTFTIWNRSI
jgi:hypothetical protein